MAISGDLQQLVNKVYTTSDKFGLRVSSTKTEVQCRERQKMKIMLGNNELVQCEDFIYYTFLSVFANSDTYSLTSNFVRWH